MRRNSTKNRSRTRHHLAEQDEVSARLVDGATTAWEVYNNIATETDKERIKDWNDSLNTLLIFATLFSAVLTAFIIESMKLIQPDPSTATRDILFSITRQLANNSIGAFEPDPFVAPAYALRVNYYFFVSITSSLIAALGAVLALQWVGSYDAGLNQSSPEERALQRHYRYQGIQKWKMDQIISFLPALVFLALFLFFIGMAEWLYQIDKGVAGIIIAGLICGASFFLITTIISMVNVGAPFRTPASRSLPRILVTVYRSVINLTSQVSFYGAKMSSIRLKELISSLRTVEAGLLQLWRKRTAALARFRSLYHYLMSPASIESFQSREKRHIQSIADIRRAALLWLLNSMDVLPHTASQLRSIIKEILLLPTCHLIDSGIEQAPWGSIFSLLLGPYLMRDREEGFTYREAEDLEPTLQAFSLVWNIPPANREFDNVFKLRNSATASYVQQAISIAFLRRVGNIDYFFGHVIAVLGAVGTFDTQFLVAHLSRLHEWQKAQPDQQIIGIRIVNWMNSDKCTLAEYPSFDLTGATSSSTLPDMIMDVMLEILALRFQRSAPPGDTPLERYLCSVETILREEKDPAERSEAVEIHDAVISQLLGRMLERNRYPQDTADGQPSLAQLEQLLHSKSWSNNHAPFIQAVFRILQRNFGAGRLWNPETRPITARIYARILPGSYSFDVRNWREWRTRFYLGLDRLLRTSEGYLSMSYQLVRNQAEFEARWHQKKPDLSSSQISRLSLMNDPILRLYASVGTSPRWVYPSTVRAARGSVNEEDWFEALGHWCSSKREEIDLNHSELALIRSIISIPTRPGYRSITRPTMRIVKGSSEGPILGMVVDPILRILSRLAGIQTIEGNAMSSASWYSLLQRPVLELLLHSDSRIHPHAVMGILLRVCVYDWFFEEFRVAGGFSWLAEEIVPRLLEKAAAIICLSLEGTDREEEVTTWMNSLYQCLTSTAALTHPRYTMNNPERFSDAIAAIQAAQVNSRVNSVRILQKNDSPLTVITIDDSLVPNEGPDNHRYVQRWSEDQWKLWQGMTEEISDGISRGFIAVGPSISSVRYMHDPDGCWSRL